MSAGRPLAVVGSQVSYEDLTPPGVEPWEPNVTALHDPAKLKWASLVDPGTPLPTVWPKAEYEAFQRVNQARRAELRAQHRPEREMNQLFVDEQAHVNQLFSPVPYRDQVGAFEGANYESSGYYRPQLNCLMFTRADAHCRVCQAAISEVIDLYANSSGTAAR